MRRRRQLEGEWIHVATGEGRCTRAQVRAMAWRAGMQDAASAPSGLAMQAAGMCMRRRGEIAVARVHLRAAVRRAHRMAMRHTRARMQSNPRIPRGCLLALLSTMSKPRVGRRLVATGRGSWQMARVLCMGARVGGAVSLV